MSKLGRRGFLGAAVAAIAGAATLAGGKTAEAATFNPEHVRLAEEADRAMGVTQLMDDLVMHGVVGVPGDMVPALTVNGTTVITGDLIVNGRSLNDMLAGVRAEGYERAEKIAAHAIVGPGFPDQRGVTIKNGDRIV